MIGIATFDRSFLEKYKVGKRRLLATILDAVITTVPYLAITMNAANLRNYTVVYWISLIYPLLQISYFVFCHYYCGQTIGKAALNIKVVDLTESKGLTFKQAVLRDMVWIFLETVGIVVLILESRLIISSTLLASIKNFTENFSTYWFLLEVITMFTNNKRRALHDFLAGTVVLKEEKTSVANIPV